MKNFRTFDLAVTFYRQVEQAQVSGHLREQLRRAAESIALNLAEGRGRPTRREQIRFFSIAMGSLRECQAALTLAGLQGGGAWRACDHLAASLYRLIKNAR